MTWLIACVGAAVAVWAVRQAMRMGPLYCHRRRIGVVLVGAAALCAMLSPLYGPPPLWLYLAACCGLALAGPSRVH